jgi:hypothetical protein
LLSQASDTPSEFEPTGRAFDQDEVDLQSPSWMACLAEVQGWLRLPEELTLDDQRQFLEVLAVGLGFADIDSAVEGVDGRYHLTGAGLERLSERLQRAHQLQDSFLANLQADGASQASATGRWIEEWEAEDVFEEEEERGDPVSARALTWSIIDFSDRAQRGGLDLSPSYQRGDVWPNSDAQMLIESILRGIPLPSVIILKPEAPDAAYEVVDGKQRLTSILRFIGKHPRALERVKEAAASQDQVDLVELFTTDYPRFRRAWKNVMGEQLTSTKEREYYFPFRLRKGKSALKGALSPFQGRYYTEIRDAPVRIADSEIEVRQLFELSTEYKIPLIEYFKATRQQIHEVFNLYNRQGKHLNAEEIRNAVYHDVAFMRALMVASGDNDDVAGVAPFLTPIWHELERLSDVLDDYGFGTARYRRSKVLSWLASMLLVESLEPGGRPKRLSTSLHINSLLSRIEAAEDDPLRDEATIRDAFLLLLQALESHSAVDEAWAPKFRDTTSGASWQELQLIASALGVSLAATIYGDDTADRLAAASSDLFTKTNSSDWRRPKKTQTATQWAYIATIAIRVVDALGVDLDEASGALIDRFGSRFVVQPATWTRLLSSSMKNSTYRRRSVTVSTVKRSQATRVAAWRRRNARQLIACRRGAGSSPAAASGRRTVLGEIRKPSLSSSPAIRW